MQLRACSILHFGRVKALGRGNCHSPPPAGAAAAPPPPPDPDVDGVSNIDAPPKSPWSYICIHTHTYIMITDLAMSISSRKSPAVGCFEKEQMRALAARPPP